MSKPDESIQGIIDRARELQRESGRQLADYVDEPQGPKPASPRVQGLTDREWKYGFENFKGNDKLVATIKEFANQGHSMMLTGRTGCGKTHLAIAAAKQLSRQAIFVTVPELLLEIRSTFNGEDSESRLIRRYARAELLVLDDLGAEKTTEYSIQTLYTIISRRNREEAQTIVTTNLDLTQIAESLGDRIASRLAEMKIVKINMPDYRQKRWE
jgi:DNA replication protein DnaC